MGCAVEVHDRQGDITEHKLKGVWPKTHKTYESSMETGGLAQ
jgi:hypothetical protein